MREIFTSGSVGGAPGNRCFYPEEGPGKSCLFRKVNVNRSFWHYKMIESISHITFIVKDVKRSADLFRSVFNAEEVYDSSDKNFSVAYEKFFLIGGTWIAIMEGNSVLERSYNHIAFKIPESDFDKYIRRVQKSGLEIIEGRYRMEGEARSIYFYDYDNHLFELHTGTLPERLSSYRCSMPR